MNIVNKLYNKWIMGHCRHICACCKYKDTCDYECKVSSNKYSEGYDNGWDNCEYNYKIILEREKEKAYSRGFYDGASDYMEEFENINKGYED